VDNAGRHREGPSSACLNDVACCLLSSNTLVMSPGPSSRDHRCILKGVSNCFVDGCAMVRTHSGGMVFVQRQHLKGCNHDDKDLTMVKSRECPRLHERGLQSEAALHKHGCVHQRSDGAFTMDDVVTMPISYKDSMTISRDVSKITGKLAICSLLRLCPISCSRASVHKETHTRPVTCPRTGSSTMSMQQTKQHGRTFVG
jgi:hypothetical protein